MKKLFCIILFLMVSASLCVQVSAKTNTYEIKELGLKISIPSEYDVITKETSASDPAFKRFGITKSQFTSDASLKNVYLDALSDDISEEIVVMKLDTSLNEFSAIGDETLEALVPLLTSQFDSVGFKVLNYDVYHHHQTKFLRIVSCDANEVIGIIQYITSTNDQTLSFTCRSYLGRVSKQQEAKIKDIIDGVYFDRTPQKKATNKEIESFVYTDTETGLKFTVPNNWEQSEFLKEKEYLDVKFTSVEDPVVSIMYGSVDLWEMAPASERIGYSRDDFNIENDTEEDKKLLMEIMGVTENKIRTVTYNNKKYYEVEVTTSNKVYGADVEMTMTQLMYIENGWGYYFGFNGTSENRYFADFEKLVNSAQYPEEKDISVTDINKETSVSAELPKNHSGLVIIPVLLIIISVCACVAVYKRETRKKEIENAEVEGETKESLKGASDWEMCENCGQIIPKDSKFCYKCGEKR